jgi:hypothetical protein
MGAVSALGGYASKNGVRLENLSRAATLAAGVYGRNSEQAEGALKRYLDALNAFAALRSHMEPAPDGDPYRQEQTKVAAILAERSRTRAHTARRKAA